MKHSKVLFGFFTSLGIVLLITLFAVASWNSIHYGSGESVILPLDFIWFSLVGGAILFTVGTCGFGRQYLRNSKNPFTRRSADSYTILAAILILSAVSSLFLHFWMGRLTVA
jgi:hypothetical protein